MSNVEVNIPGNWRTEHGKEYAKKIRTRGIVPANLLLKGKAKSLEIEAKWLSKAWLNGKEFNLQIDGAVKRVSIKELQLHPVKRTPIHVDLMYI